MLVSLEVFREKGFLFNNAYIYASKEERERMNKTPHYKQSGTVFVMVGIIFLLNAVDILIKTRWIFYIVIAVALCTIIYAIVSSILIERKKG